MTKFSLKSDLVKYIPLQLERNWDGDRILSKIAGSTRDFWPSISSLLYPLIFKVFFLYFLFYHLPQIFLKYLFRSMICSGCLLLPLAQACVSFIPDHSYSILSLPLNPCQSIWFLIYFSYTLGCVQHQYISSTRYISLCQIILICTFDIIFETFYTVLNLVFLAINYTFILSMLVLLYTIYWALPTLLCCCTIFIYLSTRFLSKNPSSFKYICGLSRNHIMWCKNFNPGTLPHYFWLSLLPLLFSFNLKISSFYISHFMIFDLLLKILNLISFSGWFILCFVESMPVWVSTNYHYYSTFSSWYWLFMSCSIASIAFLP